MYTVNIETFKEDKLTIEMVDADALVKISLDQPPNVEFANNLHGKWTSQAVLPAGPYLVKVAFLYVPFTFFLYFLIIFDTF